MTIASISLTHGEPELLAGARSYIYQLFAGAFAFPDDRLCEQLASGAWFENLAALSRHLPHQLALEPPPEVVPDALREAYVSVFEVGPGKPYCPLYEGSHRSGRMKLMEELVRFYEHFGLRTAAGDHPDHLCTELEFMHYLAFKEAAAAAHGDDVAGLRLAQHDLLDRHLCRWLPRLSKRLAGAPALPSFYLYLVQLVDTFCREDRVATGAR